MASFNQEREQYQTSVRHKAVIEIVGRKGRIEKKENKETEEDG